MKTIAFFNNKGGVGKTPLVYHLAWMLADMGHNVIAADLDPQSNLTSAFLDDEQVEPLWGHAGQPATIVGALRPIIDSLGDVTPVHVVSIHPNLGLIAGDQSLSEFEDRVSEAWTKSNSDARPTAGDGFRVMTAFYRVVHAAATMRGSELALLDVGPNIGAMNRAALIAADYVVIPLGADLFSLQGLRNLGPTLRAWRDGWEHRLKGKVPSDLVLPTGSMTPLGYVVLNPSVRENRPVKAYRAWSDRIPHVYSEAVLAKPIGAPIAKPDPNQLAAIKHFKSLMPLAQASRKPMFHLTAADGAIGGHAAAVSDCHAAFKELAERLLHATGLDA